jgi:hypothetical protein
LTIRNDLVPACLTRELIMSSLLTIAHGSRQGASNDEVRQLADQIHAQQVLTSHLGASTTLPAAILGMAT